MDDDLIAALCVTVVDEPPDEPGVRRLLGWAIAVWGHGVDEAPLALIHDVGFLLLRGRAVRLMSGRERFAIAGDNNDDDNSDDNEDNEDGDDNDDDGPRAGPAPSPSGGRVGRGPRAGPAGTVNESVGVDDGTRALVRAERLRFEDRVVAPLLRDESLRTAAVIIAGAPAGQQDALIVHALLTVLERLLAGVSLPRNQPGPVRGLLDKAGALERIRLGSRGVFTMAVDVALLQDAALDLGMVAAAQEARGSGRQLLAPEELWELSRLDVLPSEAVRLALRTVHHTMVGIGPPSPTVVRQLKDRRAQVITDDTEADTFPAGGFDAMSTRGTLENLVRSEVAYVGVGAEDDPRRPDLFDVRYVEGELLYYTRDESPLLERRRTVVVHIDEVERSRHKLAELPTQTLVLVEAVILRAHADLQVALGPQVVLTRIAVTGADDVAVAEEVGLLSTSLAEDIAHRRAGVVPLEELPQLRRVTFSPRPPPTPPPAVRGWLWIRVGGRLWSVTNEGGTVEIDPRSQLRLLVDRLMLQA